MSTVTDGSGDVIETVYGDVSNALEGLVAARNYPTYREEYGYDDRNRMVLTKQMLVAPSKIKRAHGRSAKSPIQSPVPKGTVTYTTHMAYDAIGNLISQIDAKGRTTQKRYDELNRLIIDIDADNFQTRYSYDSRDNLLTVTDANNNTHTLTYDQLGRKLTEARPMGQTITYTYDPNGNLTERLSPNGAIRKYVFDDDDRLEREEHYPPGIATPSKTNSFTYDRRGLLLSYADGLTAGEYEYDDKGQKITETITFGTGTPEVFSKTLRRTYEPNGLLKSLTYPDGGVQHYTYDNDNQLLTYKIPGLEAGNDTLTYTYRWNGIQTITMPGGLKRTVTLDPLQRPERIEVKPIAGGAPIMDHRYEYDPVSNINKKTTLDGDYVYGYDNLDRLTSAVPPVSLQVSPSNSDGLPVEGYAYDPVHNRIRSDHQPGLWVYNANNELKEWGAAEQRRVVDYDLNGSTARELKGEVAGAEDTEYVYDPQDRLVEVKRNGVTVVRYAYDPMGRRVWRSSDNGQGYPQWFLYSDEGVIEEVGTTGVKSAQYGWHTDASLLSPLWQSVGAAFSLVHEDEVGAPANLTDGVSDSAASSISRQSFGRPASTWSGSLATNWQLPGQYDESTSGLFYNLLRFYRPDAGRFNEADPAGLADGSNLYVFAKNNPLKYYDSLGLWAEIRCRPIGSPNGDLPLKTSVARGLGGEHCYVVVDCPEKGLDLTHISYLSPIVIASRGGRHNNDTIYSEQGRYRVVPHWFPDKQRDRPCELNNCKFEQCLFWLASNMQSAGYQMRNYSIFGPNSNSFVYYLIRTCGGVPSNPGPVTGWGDKYARMVPQ
jgi:RHS repeat-associated protein